MSAERAILVLHGGCGVQLVREKLSEQRQRRCNDAMLDALRAGGAELNKCDADGGGAVSSANVTRCVADGHSINSFIVDTKHHTACMARNGSHNAFGTAAEHNALRACIAAIRVLEDCPEFNAGRGSVLAADGSVEMDAGIMCGRTGNAGGVSTIKRVTNPIVLAGKVLEHGTHALLCGAGAERFATQVGVPTVQDDSYFRTDMRTAQLNDIMRNAGGGHVAPACDHSAMTQGTVGAVALHTATKCLAAASSTGGMCAKLPGRVSDSSISGAGFWADSDVAASATGNGDHFIRLAACRRLADMRHLLGVSVADAAKRLVTDEVHALHASIGGDPSAGVIALDSDGNATMQYNTPGMFRAWLDHHGRMHFAVFDHVHHTDA